MQTLHFSFQFCIRFLYPPIDFRCEQRAEIDLLMTVCAGMDTDCHFLQIEWLIRTLANSYIVKISFMVFNEILINYADWWAWITRRRIDFVCDDIASIILRNNFFNRAFVSIKEARLFSWITQHLKLLSVQKSICLNKAVIVISSRHFSWIIRIGIIFASIVSWMSTNSYIEAACWITIVFRMNFEVSKS